jgi:hypothetical protein
MSNNKNIPKKNKTEIGSVPVTFKSDWDTKVKENLRGWLEYDFDYLTFLYNHESHHQGIVDAKAKYVSGTKIVASTPQGTEWLKKWNPTESAYEVMTPVDRNYSFVGTRAIEVIPNLAGVPLWFFHKEFSRCRISICQTKVYYCEDWTQEYKYGVEEYPIWYKGCKEPAIMLYRRFNQTTKSIEAAYAGLEYRSGVKTIHTLCAITNSRHSLVKNDMGTGSIVTIFAPKPETKAEQEKIVNQIKGNYAGDENTGEVTVIWAEDGQKGAEFSSAPTNGLEKRYSEMNSQSIRDVYAAHQVPPELFKYIKDGSSLFENKDVIINQHELFMNEYVIPEQVHKLKMINTLFEARFPGQKCEFTIEQFDPIGQEIPLDNQTVVDTLNSVDPNIIINYLDRKLKLNLPKATLPNGQPAPSGTVAPIVASTKVNEHLKNLTGTQNIEIDRIVRKYKKGTYSEAMAILRLTSGFGLSEGEAKQYLGTQDPPVNELPIQQRVAMAKQFDFFAKLDSMAHDSVDDEVLEVNYVGQTQFSKITFSALDAIRNLILNKIKANPEASVEDIVAATGQSADVVNDALKWLKTKKVLSGVVGDLKTKQKDKKAVVYTEYNYALRPDLKAKGEPTIKDTTRDWCREMYAKYKVGKKALSFEAIDSMTDDLDMNAWDFRGGFNGNDPFCRHVWQGTTKVRYE